MVESKRKLIETLTKTYAEVDTLPEKIEKESIYLEDGFLVDVDFMTAIMQFINYHVCVGNRVMKALHALLGIEEGAPKQEKKKDGKKWSAAEVLKHCVFSDGVLRLPDVQLNPKSYAETTKWITEAGGKWKGGKTQGFVFDFDATRVVSILMEGKRCNLQQEFQFFETPPELADWLVSLAGVSDGDVVLEPSAGRGAIIKAVHRAAPNTVVDYFELMPENRQFLEKMENVCYCGEDFTKGTPRLYTRIFANPPFSNNQDIRHVKAMYEALDYGGVLCAITSRHWAMGSEKACVEFREWLDRVGGEMHEIPGGVFKESGTEIATAAVKIVK